MDSKANDFSKVIREFELEIRVKARKEFAERLKKKKRVSYNKYKESSYEIKYVDIDDIDNLLKEMEEENA